MGTAVPQLLPELVPPIIEGFGDPDASVRFHAYEAMFSIGSPAGANGMYSYYSL